MFFFDLRLRMTAILERCYVLGMLGVFVWSRQSDIMIKLNWKTVGMIALLAAIPIAMLLSRSANKAQAIDPLPDPLPIEGGVAILRINRAQQAYFAEYNRFSGRWESLGLESLGAGVPRFTPHYNHCLVLDRLGPRHYAFARLPTLKSFVGRVIPSRLSTGETISESITCENNMLGLIKPALPEIDTTLNLACAPGTTRWTISSNYTPEQGSDDHHDSLRKPNP